MKIGILTFHRAENYGAMLQAVALRETLVNMGHEVGFIDYWPAYHANLYKVWSINKVIRKNLPRALKYCLTNIFLIPWRQMRHKKFKFFFEKNIQPYLLSTNSTVDYVVYGSDQIWRKASHNNLIDKFYLSQNNIKGCKHIAYAASMGSVNLSLKDKELLIDNLKNFKAISVREEELQTALKEININSQTVLDPTLLIKTTQWEKYAHPHRIIKEKYLLFYDLQRGSISLSTAKRIAKDKNLRLVVISYGATMESFNNGYLTSEKIVIGPSEFLALFRDSDFVLTSSFHGLSFAIIYGKQFLCSMESGAERAKSLLKMMNLINNFVPSNSNIITIPLIDYSIVYAHLQSCIEKSKYYLKASLT